MLVLVFLTASLIIAVKPVSAATEDSWVSRAPMQEARANFGIAVVDGRIYAFGGDNGSPMGNLLPPEIRTYYTLSTNEVYDPATDTWETRARARRSNPPAGHPQLARQQFSSSYAITISES